MQSGLCNFQSDLRFPSDVPPRKYSKVQPSWKNKFINNTAIIKTQCWRQVSKFRPPGPPTEIKDGEFQLNLICHVVMRDAKQATSAGANIKLIEVGDPKNMVTVFGVFISGRSML